MGWDQYVERENGEGLEVQSRLHVGGYRAGVPTDLFAARMLWEDEPTPAGSRTLVGKAKARDKGVISDRFAQMAHQRAAERVDGQLTFAACRLVGETIRRTPHQSLKPRYSRLLTTTERGTAMRITAVILALLLVRECRLRRRAGRDEGPVRSPQEQRPAVAANKKLVYDMLANVHHAFQVDEAEKVLAP